jgi:hypothetical protein
VNRSNGSVRFLTLRVPDFPQDFGVLWPLPRVGRFRPGDVTGILANASHVSRNADDSHIAPSFSRSDIGSRGHRRM